MTSEPVETPPSGGRTAFLTGATGFLGANLTRELLDRGWRAHGTYRKTSNRAWLAGQNIDLAEADLMDLASLEAAIPPEADAVMHLAADLRLSDRSTDLQVETNVQGTRNLLEAARRRGARKVVLVSSMAAFGIHDGVVDEDVASNALSVPVAYFRSKRLAELEAEKAIDAGLDVTIVNPANIVGAFDVDNLPATLVRMVATSALPMFTVGRTTFCHARAVAAAIVNAADAGQTGRRYLLGGGVATTGEFMDIASAVTGGAAPRAELPRFDTLEDAMRIGKIAERFGYHFLTPEVVYIASHDMMIDDSRAQKELGYAPGNLRQMICDSANWLRDRGYLRTI